MEYYDRIIEIYEEELNLPNNKNCVECDSSYKQPLLPWQIGSKYDSEVGRIFIAGKPHRGTLGQLRDSRIIDGRSRAKELFFNENWPYWSYTKSALNKIYGTSEESWEHIAFSNIVKCSNTDNIDKTSLHCVNKCVTENKVIFKEIELLKPRKILFFTWSLHRGLFRKVPFADPDTVIEHTDSNHRVQCGKKLLGWWDRTFTSTWGEKVDFLIIGHPERMKKTVYVEKVSEWLKK